MARTSKARRRTRKGPARTGKARARKETRKRAKPARRAKAAKRPARASKRTARAAKRPAKRARRPAQVAKRPTKPAKRPAKAAAKARPKAKLPQAAPKRPNPRPRTLARPPLDRVRRVLGDDERLDRGGGAAREEAEEHLTSSAHAGHDALRAELGRYTEAGPELTAGDLDAKWQDAYAVGDETPGGDNPTPDQDRVDDIGKAMGIQYQDDQELMGGDEVLERDKHRWELDPASSEDWPHKE